MAPIKQSTMHQKSLVVCHVYVILGKWLKQRIKFGAMITACLLVCTRSIPKYKHLSMTFSRSK